MAEIPKTTPIEPSTEASKQNAPPASWESPRAEDVVVVGDEKEITRKSNQAYADSKVIRRGFDEQERQAEIDELEAMYRAPSVAHPGPERLIDREIEGIWASWTARPPEQTKSKPETERASRLRKFAKSVFRNS